MMQFLFGATPFAIMPKIVDQINKSGKSPDSGGASGNQNPEAPGANSGTVSEVVKKLIGMGWTQPQASGIAASFTQESNLRHDAVNPKSGARGIGQWLGSRVSDFKAWAGHDLKSSTIDEQLQFFHHEVTNGKEQDAGRKLRATKTAAEAARVHSEAYERPGKDEANNARRMRIAEQINTQLSTQNAAAAANMPAGAKQLGGRSLLGGNTSTTDVKVANINIQTQATDAKGIAQAIAPAVENYSFVMQANGGLF